MDERIAKLVANLPDDVRARVEAAKSEEELRQVVESYSDSADLTPEELDLVSGGCNLKDLDWEKMW